MAKKDDGPNLVEFEGLSGQLKDSRFLSADDLPRDQDIEVEIEKVYKAEDFDMYRGPKEKERVAVAGFLQFKGKKKLYKLSATNRKTLDRLFGNVAKNWKGKRILIFVDFKDAFGNPEFPWIRFRNRDINAQSGARNMRAVVGGGPPEPPPRDSAPPAPAPGDRPDVEWDGPKATTPREAGQD